MQWFDSTALEAIAMQKLSLYLTKFCCCDHRCINKAMGPNKDITYTINGLHGGEIRWDCKESDDDAEKLGEYGYNLEDTTVHCEDVKGDCKVVYKLGISLDFF